MQPTATHHRKFPLRGATPPGYLRGRNSFQREREPPDLAALALSSAPVLLSSREDARRVLWLSR